MSNQPTTPAFLAQQGYCIHFGDPDNVEVELHNLYWWTWSKGSGIDCSPDNFVFESQAVESAYEDLCSHMRASPREIAATLAGLRLLQLELDNPDNDGWFGEDLQQVYTDGGTIEGLTSDEIDSLCERLNSA